MITKINVGLFGNGPWALKAFKKLLVSEDYSICFFVQRFNMFESAINEIAQEKCIPVYNIQDINDQKNIDLLLLHKPDIFISMSYDQILKSKILNSTRFGFINCHAGLLPFYRGRNSLNWSLINGEKNFGITVHVIDEGIDTGPVIKQEMFPISKNSNYSDILEIAYEHCPEILMRALKKYISDPSDVVLQTDISKNHSYFSKRSFGDEWIDWSWNCETIHNLVRGIASPGPGARTMILDKEIAILKTKLIVGVPAHVGMNGQIVGNNADGSVIKCGESAVTICSYSVVDENGFLSQERPANFQLGVFFGLKNQYEFFQLKKRVKKLEADIQHLRSERH